MTTSRHGDDPKALLMTSEPTLDDKQADESATSSQGVLLKRRTKSAWIVACYAVVLIVPWVLTIIINYRPIGGGSYYDQAAKSPPSDFDRNVPIIGLVNIVNAIAALATIPVINSVLSQAAVAFTQRKSAQQAVNLGQTLALADRGWNDLQFWYGVLRYRSAGALSRMLVHASVLVIIGAVGQPLQQYLVRQQTIQTITVCDVPYAGEYIKGCKEGPHEANGFDVLTTYVPLALEPDLAQITNAWQTEVIQQMLGDLRVGAPLDSLPQLWGDGSLNQGSPSTLIQNVNMRHGVENDYYISTLPNATSTGVIRQHALRLNSTVQCDELSNDDMPYCPEDHSIRYEFSNEEDDRQVFTINLCLPQGWNESPWRLERSAQDIFEYVTMSVAASADANATDFAVNCTGRTTMGYFELPNLKNGNRAQPLVRNWPPEGLFNDCPGRACVWNNSLLPEPPTLQTHLPDWAQTPSPGPLTLTFLALFGNGSFVDVLQDTTISANHTAEDICQEYYPFDTSADLCAANSSFDMMRTWIRDLESPESLLGSSMLYALTALLQQSTRQQHNWSGHSSAEKGYGQGAGRTLLYSPGHTTQKLAVTTGGIIAISVFIFLQLAGLAGLLLYIRAHPTWTSRLDAGAMFRLGGGFDQYPDSMAGTSEVHTPDLTRRNGLVGLLGQDEGEGVVRRPTLEGLHPLSVR